MSSARVKQLLFLIRILVGRFALRQNAPFKRPYDYCFVKIDAIGDFVLFRNLFLEFADQSAAPILLIGNEAFRDLAESLECPRNVDFLWVNPTQLRNSGSIQDSFLVKVRRLYFKQVVNPCFSRTLLSDLIVLALNAKQKNSWRGDDQNQRAILKVVTDRFYDELYSSPSVHLFEFLRNQELFDHLSASKSEVVAPNITIATSREEVVSIFLGASRPERRWSPTGYSEVARSLNDRFGLRVRLLGGMDAIEDAKIFVSRFGRPLENLVGKTTLVELVAISARSKLNISNDSSYPHICVSTGSPVIVISNGNHLGRFVPYPKQIYENYRVVFPFSEELLTVKERHDLYEGSRFNILSIKVEEVLKIAIELLQELPR